MLSAAMVEQWPDAVLLTDAKGVIEYVNPAFERLTGYRAREVLGHTPAIVKSGRHDARFYRQLWSRLRRGQAFRGVFLNRRKNGELFHEEEIIRPLRGARGRVTHFLCTGRDVSALMRELERLERLATHDALTGLTNRALYADRLVQALSQAERRREAMAVAFIDLDDFKRVNTRYGHPGGDAVLKAVARRTRRCLRAIDTVARIGGDEFALVLPAVRTRGAAARVLEKVRAANAAAVRYGRVRIPMSVSIGASLYPRDGRSAAALRKRADAALYRAKRAGGNRYRFARG
ncbi:MAG TPA: diguanylate cyclase [Burkholderiales bacterium]|nr:diguanylate cyclase [Burkholderiales bacterium]